VTSFQFALYIDSANGSDLNDGLSPSSPWRTLSRLESVQLVPGTAVLLKRGCTWREKLDIAWSGSPGNPILFGAYGDGEPPLLLGSVNCNDPSNWTLLENGLWATAPDSFPADVGFILFGSESQENVGFKRLDASQLSSERDFYYDEKNRRVVVRCNENPAEKYGTVEVAYSRSNTDHLIKVRGEHDIIIDGLELKYFNSHGIQMSGGVSRIVIRNCKITFGGGQIQHGSVRYGNGIEFWESAQDCLVEHNVIGQIYDAAVTNQGLSTNQQRNITYICNVLFNSEYLYEYWNRDRTSRTEDIGFFNNSLIGAGFGWSHRQRPDPSGHGLSFHKNTAQVKNFKVNSNLFINATESCVFISKVWTGIEQLELSRNVYCQLPRRNVVTFMGRGYDASSFEAYKSETGNDIHSKVVDPEKARQLEESIRRHCLSSRQQQYAVRQSGPPSKDLWIYRDGLEDGWALRLNRATAETVAKDDSQKDLCEKISFEGFCTVEFSVENHSNIGAWMYDSVALSTKLDQAHIDDILLSKTGSGAAAPPIHLLEMTDSGLIQSGWNGLSIPIDRLGWTFGSQLQSLKLVILGNGTIYLDDVRLSAEEQAGPLAPAAIGAMAVAASVRSAQRSTSLRKGRQKTSW